MMEKFIQGQVQKGKSKLIWLDSKLWFQFNDFFLKLDRKSIVELIEKGNNLKYSR